MAPESLPGISLQLPSSGHRLFIPLRLLPLSTTACISLQLPSSPHRPSIRLAQHLLCSGHLSPRCLRPLSLSATAASAFSSASAARPLTSRRSQNIQPQDELLETDGAGWNGGTSGGGGALGDHDGDNNRKKLLMVPPRDDWSPVASETEDEAAIVPGSVVSSSSELEKFLLLRMLEGLMERLLADDVFLARVAVECGLGIFTKAMDLMADFMILHLLPLPTASLPPALLAKFFHGIPDNTFEITLPGSSYSLAQRLGALAIIGGKLCAVGTASSMVRNAVKNALIDAMNVTGKSSGDEVENLPIVSTGLAYGVYMVISDSLRCQVLSGVIKQRILEPLLHQHKLMPSAIRFAARTENTDSP